MNGRRSVFAAAAVPVVAAITVLALPGKAAEPPPSAASLPSVRSGHRPGPDILYAPPPRAPQLENRDPRFRAAPLLVSGTEAYIDGEYLYQDYLHDDYGADVNNAGGNALTYNSGDVTYPTDRARYAGNAADLVELRIAPGVESVAYRITLNTLVVPDSSIVTIAFDTDNTSSTGRSVLPRDPGSAFPGTDQVLTAWGTGAEHSALGAAVKTTPVTVVTDLEANQMTVTVPRSVSDPHGTWKAIVAVGVYDKPSGGWARPARDATATTPGGGAPQGGTSAVFNLAFRFDEPTLRRDAPPDTNQAAAIQANNLVRYQRAIDFAALDAKVARSTVPATGTMMRIYPSRLSLPEGRDLSRFPEVQGQLQPYSLYVPTTYKPGRRVGFTMQPHSLSDHAWQYNGSDGVQQIGEQRHAIVATGEGHGHDGWAIAEAEVDVFEVWADVAAHYDLDPDRAAICGYSMGGYATYRLAGLYPDLFGKAFTTVGPPIDGIWLPPANSNETLTNLWLENVRNVPFLNVNASADELVPLPGPRAQNMGAPELGIRGFEQLGYRFRWQVYTPAEHLTLSVLSYDLPQAVDFLGDARVDRDPAHVTFAYLPKTDNAKLGLVHDHAYWLSNVRLADPSRGTPVGKGVVDAFSHAFGRGDPPSEPSETIGAYPLPYVEHARTWLDAPAAPRENKLDLTLDNVGAVDVDVARAGLDAARPVTLVVNAGAPVTLRLAGVSVPAPAGRSTLVVDLTNPAAPVVSASGTAAETTRRPLPATGADNGGRAGAALGLVATAALLARLSRTVRACRPCAANVTTTSSS